MTFCARPLRCRLDYADPNGERVELALLKVPAEGERIGSLVVNPGGPGASGIDYASAAERVFRKPVARGVRHRWLRPSGHRRQPTRRLPH